MKKKSLTTSIIEVKMKMLGITQRQMAKAFMVSPRTWQYWMESPEKIQMKDLNAIADILHLTDEEYLKAARF